MTHEQAQATNDSPRPTKGTADWIPPRGQEPPEEGGARLVRSSADEAAGGVGEPGSMDEPEGHRSGPWDALVEFVMGACGFVAAMWCRFLMKPLVCGGFGHVIAKMDVDEWALFRSYMPGMPMWYCRRCYGAFLDPQGSTEWFASDEDEMP